MSVAVVGDVMTDVIVRPEGPLVRGSDRRARIRRMPGGSAANQAVWLAHFGVPVRLLARVGAADRDALEAHFTGRGVTPLLVPDADLQTGVLVTIVDPDGERSFLTDRGANLALTAADLPEAMLDGCSHLVVSGYSFFAEGPRSAALAALAAARSRGVAVVIDPASDGFLREVGADAFIGWTCGAALLLANADEAAALSGSSDMAEQVRRLGASYERVVVKRGALGACIGTAAGIAHSAPAPVCDVVDTTGAGDAFAGAFIAAELAGADAAGCLRKAVAAGSAAVGFVGGQPPDTVRG